MICLLVQVGFFRRKSDENESEVPEAIDDESLTKRPPELEIDTLKHEELTGL